MMTMNLSKFDPEIELVAEQLTKEMANDFLFDPDKSLLPAHAQKMRIKSEIKEALSTYFASLSNGLAFLLVRLHQMTNDAESPLDKAILDSIITKFSEKKEEGLTNQELSKLFSAAIGLYNDQKYEHAVDAFYVLTQLKPDTALFWKCFGTANLQCSRYKEAIGAYTMSLSLFEDDPQTMLYLASCFEKENRTHEAISTLERAAEIAAKDSELYAVIPEMLQGLHHNKGGIL